MSPSNNERVISPIITLTISQKEKTRMDSFTSNQQQQTTAAKTIFPHNVASVARSLMNQWGLGHWVFQLDNAKRRAGCCKYSRRTISLSRYFVQNNPDEEILDCIRHEISHSLAGPKAGHGPVWKAMCRKVGCRPVRCYNSAQVKMPEAKYKAVCGGCQRVFHRHRRPGANRWRYCLKCGPEKGKLEFRCS